VDGDHRFEVVSISFLAAVVLLLVSTWAEAATSCYQWRMTINATSTAWVSDAKAAAQAGVDLCNASSANKAVCDNQLCTTANLAAGATCTFSLNWIGFSAFPTVNSTNMFHLHYVSSTGAVTDRNDTVTNVANQVDPAGCPTCGAAGQTSFLGGSGTVPGQSCVSGCLYNTPSAGTQIHCNAGSCSSFTVYEATSTGQQCGGTDAGAGAAVGTQADCDASGTICRDTGTGGKNCGMFNGDRVCVGTVPKGTCVGYSSGGAACVSAAGTGNAATPPAPNNGTPGTTATPSATVSANGQTVNYYSSTVVGGSTAAPTTGAPVQGDPIGTQGTGTSPQPGECDGDACTGTTPTLESLDSFQAITQGFMGRVEGSALLTTVTGLGAAVPSGVCPRPTLALFGTTFTWTTMCDLWDQISGVINAVMLAVWGLLAVRIVLSA